MKKFFCAAALSVFLSFTAAAAEFSLCDIYATPAEFDSALQLNGLEEQAAALKGKLQSPNGMAEAAKLLERGSCEFDKLFAYSYLDYANNTLHTAAKERLTAVRNAATRFDSIVAPLRNELAAQRGAELPNEGVLRALSPSIAFPSELASIVLNADFNAPVITRPDGTKTAATYAELARAMHDSDKSYRKSVYEAYYGALSAHRNTLAAAMEAHYAGRVQQSLLLDANLTHEQQTMLSRYQMPPKTADVLLSKVYKTTGVQGRGQEIAAKKQGVDKLAPYDIQPAAGTEPGRYSFDDAKQLVLAALEPLGADYLSIASRILESGHVNFAPSPNKQSGAFCVPAGKDTDPYIHMSFDGSPAGVSTLAHELGHAVHFVLSRTQPPAYAQPTLAVTETAAIFNEILLSRHMLKQAGDIRELECAASLYADLISGSLYNQARLFAFERAAFNHVRGGGALTADKCDSLWELVSAPFRGPHTSVPECAKGAWASVPHLYRDFYVINYSFSAAAAEVFAEKTLDKGPKEYLEFLSSGSSKPAYDLFCGMGVDFLREQAYNDVVERLDELYDILEVRLSNAA